MTSIRPSWLSSPEAQKLAEVFSDHKDSIRFVGGCVRDSLTNQVVGDLDMATSLTPDMVMQIASGQGVKVIPTGLKHGTVTVVIDKKPIEITTLRKDTACDGRHAEVEFTDSWEEDASRRDFTMNALYLSFDGELFDYMGGAADATAGRLCFIGNAGQRIKEDYLRILRFFRFFATHATGVADEEALAACKEHKEGMQQLSGERIQQEMCKLLGAPSPLPAIRLMQETGVLEELIGTSNLPCFEALLTIEGHVEKIALPPTRMATLLMPENVSDVAARWMFSRAACGEMRALYEGLEIISSDITQRQQKKLLRQYGAEAFGQLALFAGAHGCVDGAGCRAMLQLAQNWEIPQFPVTGTDLKERGFNEGKTLGEKLEELEASWEASDYTLSKEKLLASVV